MKRSILVFIIFSLIISSGCKKTYEIRNDELSRKTQNEKDKVTMIIKDGTITDKGATIIIGNAIDSDAVFGSYYRIEENIDGKWIEVPYIIDSAIVAWEDIAYPVSGNDNETLELKINWEWLYGQLDKGTYRIIKDYFMGDDYLAKEIVSAEFIIE